MRQEDSNFTQHSRDTADITKQLDEMFIVYMLEIDARYRAMTKQERIRVEQWVSFNIKLDQFSVKNTLPSQSKRGMEAQ